MKLEKEDFPHPEVKIIVSFIYSVLDTIKDFVFTHISRINFPSSSSEFADLCGAVPLRIQNVPNSDLVLATGCPNCYFTFVFSVLPSKI
jgi:hypothetical protein